MPMIRGQRSYQRWHWSPGHPTLWTSLWTAWWTILLQFQVHIIYLWLWNLMAWKGNKMDGSALPCTQTAAIYTQHATHLPNIYEWKKHACCFCGFCSHSSQESPLRGRAHQKSACPLIQCGVITECNYQPRKASEPPRIDRQHGHFFT